jgi:predicted transcriptional regulator
MIKKDSKITQRRDSKSEVIGYLKIHGIADEDEIAQALNLHIIDVLDALLGLEKKGIVKRVDEVLSVGS